MKEITVCLSGGGVRGLAHVGVLQYLVENNFSISAISGTSAGSLIGAFFCDGFHPNEIINIIKTQLKRPTISFRHWKRGIIDVGFFKNILVANLKTQQIENLKIPFFANATNYITGEIQLFDSGDIIPAVMASSAIPIVFPPVIINNTPYVDGGLACNLNTQPLKEFEKPIVGVHVNPLMPYNATANLYTQMERLVKLSIRIGAVNNIKDCHIFIEPKELEKYAVLDVKSFEKIIEIGYNSAAETFKETTVIL